jgi:hypothetical protein
MLDHQMTNAVFYGSAIALVLSVVSAVIVGDGVSKRPNPIWRRPEQRRNPPSPARASCRAFCRRERSSYPGIYP